jgi:hypothetical protein
MLARPVATCVLGSVMLLAACSAPMVHNDRDHAIAIAYLNKPLGTGFTLGGTFSLPRAPANRGWYADWFTYTQRPVAGVVDAPFLQVGLIRSPDAKFRLRPFIASHPLGKRVVLRTLAFVPEDPHSVTLESKGGTLSFVVDGAVLYRAPTRAYFPPGTLGTYLQIGHELSAPGDSAKGSITGVRFSYGSHADALPLGPGSLDCYFFSNGVRWDGTASSLVARGTFDPGIDDAANCKT